MTRPAWLSGCNTTAQRYDRDFPGAGHAAIDVLVLHTTEGVGWPSYDGGAKAPNITALPIFALRKLELRGHFPLGMSSRALRNLAGGVQTNQRAGGVVQLELIGTSSRTVEQAWKLAGRRRNVDYIYWPEAPDWALQGLARIVAELHAQWELPLLAANFAGDRLGANAWQSFDGICGHMHVPENDHSDPGAIDGQRIITLAKALLTGDDDMATPQEIATAVWQAAWPTTPGHTEAAQDRLVQAARGTNLDDSFKSISEAFVRQNVQIQVLGNNLAALTELVKALAPKPVPAPDAPKSLKEHLDQ